MRAYESIALGIPEILLPKTGTDLAKWAVIACDQYTSEPAYWEKAAVFVGEAPSTLRLIYPEVFLNEPEGDKSARIARIRETMSAYFARNLFDSSEGLVYVERTTGGKTRKGLVVALDLERYDYRKSSTTLIRATEGTIIERIPPRVRIREGAPMELPHIMVLIDDPAGEVIGPLAAATEKLEKLYDFELMLGSGHLAGYRVSDRSLEDGIVRALSRLVDPRAFAAKYGLKEGTPVLLYAMGDGNHSLATAKTIWEKTKEAAGDLSLVMNSPLRYAIVELVNVHDEALAFEPIHRVLFDLAPGRNFLEELKSFYGGKVRYEPSCCLKMMKAAVDGQSGPAHRVGVITPEEYGVLEVEAAGSNLPVGTLQNFLDIFMKNKGAREIDYVHGTEIVTSLGEKSGNMGFYLSGMRKTDLFKTVILDGALPRKTFSMGEAWEKRFYMEGRRLG
ncbi:MAG: DUF1015 domain-containing protein [Candidatus Aminicenantes bacterium]|nr:DUF1015 domain-containing protein [Candidatus Aminicenantes bacterium]